MPGNRGVSGMQFQSALRFAVVSDSANNPPAGKSRFQSALRFAVVSDYRSCRGMSCRDKFQSALRFAVVSDVAVLHVVTWTWLVSIRFKVRGGFRLRGLFIGAF